ncbi:uncharacterized protein [Coffea arabica]|uniref:Uncharacterized protein isoform X1 n=1 Tax=Coffea arabica TaxID=13443 RepID=A0A6P6V5C1_COFAR
MASTTWGFDASVGLNTPNISAFTNHKRHLPVTFLSLPPSSRPPPNFVIKSSRSRVCQRKITSKQFLGVPVLSCLVGDNAGVYPESREASNSSHSPQDAAFDIKLPRRSLLVKFTCNLCGSRSEKLVNRLAYERGTVFVQCSGCRQHHKLVDNLGLVVEYDFREEMDSDSNANRC